MNENLINDIKTYELMKKHLSLRLFKRDWYSDMSERCPHFYFCDMTVVPFLNFCNTYGFCGTMNVTYDIANSWNIDIETLFCDAMENLEEHTCIRKAEDVLCELRQNQKSEEIEKLLKLREDNLPMYILSNKNTFYGSCHILDQYAMMNAVRGLESDVLAFPSSVHEWILVPADCFDMDRNALLDKMSRIVKEVNRLWVEPRDQLTDRAYIFCRDTYGRWSLMDAYGNIA